MFDDFISTDSAPVYSSATGKKVSFHLLWGDGVKILEPGEPRTKVRARGRNRYGYVNNKSLGGKSLLEMYFIDVGQGDGILIKTPGFRHIMIDGGYPREQQDTQKNAADFVDWKFYQDYCQDQIRLEAMVASHCDLDHYGGLWDLLDVSQSNELKSTDTFVQAFYHAGIAWWKKGGGGKTLGLTAKQNGKQFYTQLMGDRSEVANCLPGGNGSQLQGWWAQFMQMVVNTRWIDNQPTDIQRLSHLTGFLPGFEPGVAGEPSIKVLAPVEFDLQGVPGLHKYSGGESQVTNGNSVLCRLDFGRVRILLTGDLNRNSQAALLEDYIGHRDEFQCDVTKSCHHGSEDISYSFLQAVQPAVTIISSGDNEGHDHPRPSIVAASAITGFQKIANDELVLPLIYSTELARSINLGDPIELSEKDAAGKDTHKLSGDAFDKSVLRFTVRKPGELQPQTKYRTMKYTLVVGGLIYGLVNVRTDGDKILCATMNEKDHTWNIKTLHSRF